MFGKSNKIEITLNEEVAKMLNDMYPTDKEKMNFVTYSVVRKAIWIKEKEIDLLKKFIESMKKDIKE